MKNLFKSLLICGLVAMISGLMSACTPDMGGDDYKGPPVLKVGEPEVISAIEVNIPLDAKKLTSVGYKLVEKVDGQEPTAPASAMLLYRGGKSVNGCPSAIKLTGNDGLNRGKTFVVFIAATISDTEFYNNGEIFSVEFTTPDNFVDDDVQVLRTHYEGADVEVIVPERIKQQNRRIKWGITDYAVIEYYGMAPDPEKLHSNDVIYPASLIKNDTTLQINHYNAYRRTKDGEIGYYYFAGSNPDGTTIQGVCGPNDPRVESGEATPTQYYPLFQPGAPLVLLLSEVAYADCPYINSLEGDAYIDHLTQCDENCPEGCTAHTNCPHLHPMIDWGWGPGYYWYPYDYQAYIKAKGGDREPGELPMPGVGGGNNNNIDFDQFWHEGAWHKHIEIRLPGPEEFTTGDVKVNISGLRPDGGKLTFTPTGDTYAYFVYICPETSGMGAGYVDLLKFVRNDPSLLQWLTTSEVGMYLGIFPFEGQTIINLEEFLYEIEANMRYHVIVNALPGKMENGDMTLDITKQKFQHLTFTLPKYTIDEPELVVTPMEAYSPYKVKFNVKNVTPNIPVKKVAYAFNYSRDFSSYMSQTGYTYEDIVLSNDGYANLTEAEVEQVNSDFGCEIEFDVRENSLSTLAVIGWNEEGRPSSIGEGSKAVAEARSLSMPAAAPLDMTKLNALKGNWTATATIKTVDYNTGNTTTSQKSWGVTIGDLKTDNALTAEQYAIFESVGVQKEAADEYLIEFNKQAADYNAAVLGQNRVLCQGWDVSGERGTSTASPWDLFLMTDYNASLVDYLFYDFGPKWYLQTDAEGNIFVPVNYNVVPPMMLWYNGMEHYLCSGNYEKGIANYIKSLKPADAFDVQSVGIPVEISEDGNTITLKSVVVQHTNDSGVTEDITLYPTMIYNNQGALAFYTPYVVSEVVLTKGAASTASTKSAVVGKAGFGKNVVNNAAFKAPAKHHSRTVMVEKVKSNSTKVNVVTKKVPTKEEIRKGMEQMGKRLGYLPRK